MKVNLWTKNSYRLWLTNWPKTYKTPEDLSQFERLLKKLSIEAALNAEMTHYLGYEKNQSRLRTNSRNGYSTKTVVTGNVPLELRISRDRDGTFEPQLVKKNQTCVTGTDIKGHRCCDGSGCRMVKPTTGCCLSHCLS